MTESRRHTSSLAIVLVTAVLFVGAVIGTQAVSRRWLGAGAGAVHAICELTGHDVAAVGPSNRTVAHPAPTASNTLEPPDSARDASFASMRLRRQSGIPTRAIVAPMRT